MDVNFELLKQEGQEPIRSTGLLDPAKQAFGRVCSTVDESLRAIETTATDIRLVAELVKINLVSAKAEATVDAISGLMARGLSADDAKHLFNSYMNN